MKVVTLFTESHKEMLNDYFLPTFPKDERLELKIVEAPQMAGDKPVFNSDEWKTFMKIKGKLLEDELLSTPEGEFYLFLDVDLLVVQNFHDFLIKEMEGYDFVCQSDSCFPHIINTCTGCIAFRNTAATRNILKAINVFSDRFKQEQEALTFFAANHTKYEELQELKYKTFSKENAFSYGLLNGRVWNEDDYDFQMPDKKDLYWAHANFTYHDSKKPLLDLFKKKLDI